ncbi:MAG: hypothetical protein K2N22_03070, partial [Clostridia bacterium]|nr:hypothetical protein [Clostridia bacterium]
MKERVRFYSKTDMINGFMLEKSLSVLKKLTHTRTYNNINDVLELYNVQKFIDAQIFRQDFTDEDKALFSLSLKHI